MLVQRARRQAKVEPAAAQCAQELRARPGVIARVIQLEIVIFACMQSGPPHLERQYLPELRKRADAVFTRDPHRGDPKNTGDYFCFKPRARFLPLANIWILCQMSANQIDKWIFKFLRCM